MAHCDSVSFAVESAKALSEPLPEPPQHLDVQAMKFWPAIVTAKRRAAWTDADLVLAATIARDLAAIEALAEALASEGHILTDARGKKYAHPAANLLDQATRRSVATARALQIHAIATTGKTDHQGKKNEAARDLANKIGAADDDLIPRLRLA